MTEQSPAVALARQAFEKTHGMPLEDASRSALNHSFDCLVQALEAFPTGALVRLQKDLAESAAVMPLASAQLWQALGLVAASVQAQRAESALADRKEASS